MLEWSTMEVVPVVLQLGSKQFGADDYVIMAVINRTPDSFYDRGRTYTFDAALDAVDQAVDEGADIIDIGGVKAGPGKPVSPTEETRRVCSLIAAARERHPGIAISVDTWRSDVAERAVQAGADILNDTWGGYDSHVIDVAAVTGTGVVCTHAGGLSPRRRPHRSAFDDVVADVLATTTRLARRAVNAGVAPERVLIDPAHDFGKNTWHSLEISRRLHELVDTGWPVLVATSNKDFIGETLALPVTDRHEGTLATLTLAAWQGARAFRVHDVRAARRTLDMVASVKGQRTPAKATRGLA